MTVTVLPTGSCTSSSTQRIVGRVPGHAVGQATGIEGDHQGLDRGIENVLRRGIGDVVLVGVFRAVDAGPAGAFAGQGGDLLIAEDAQAADDRGKDEEERNRAGDRELNRRAPDRRRRLAVRNMTVLGWFLSGTRSSSAYWRRRTSSRSGSGRTWRGFPESP